jgi:hypothetical protein
LEVGSIEVVQMVPEWPPSAIENEPEASRFVLESSARRVLGGALLFALVLPPTSRVALRSISFKRLRKETGLFPGLFESHGWAAALGGFGGLCEDICCRMSYKETLEHREPIEIEMW